MFEIQEISYRKLDLMLLLKNRKIRSQRAAVLARLMALPPFCDTYCTSSCLVHHTHSITCLALADS